MLILACLAARDAVTASISGRIRAALNTGQNLLRAVADEQSEVLLVGGKALGDRVRATYLLEPGGDLGVIQVGVVATLTADELKRARVTALHPAVHDQDRLAAQHRSAAMTGITSLRGRTETWTTGPQPRITGVMRAARCGDGSRTVG